MSLIPKRFIFLGPQGSGKGTQAKMLADFLNIAHISTGEIFRAAVDQDTILGKRIAAGLGSGKLILDDDTNTLVADRLSAVDVQNGFVLDGYPRTLNQANFLEKTAAPQKAILLELLDNEAIRRLMGRTNCSKCGAVFHEFYKRPKKDEACDSCGGDLVKRRDDTEESIAERLRLYHRETEPIITFYESLGRLVRVDGRPGIAEVHIAVKQALNL